MGFTKNDIQDLAAGKGAFSITPDNNTYIQKTRGIYIGGGNNLTVDMADGSTVTFTALATGVIHPISVVRVYATGTDATSILGIV